VIKFGKGGLKIACKNIKIKNEKLGGGDETNVK